MYRRIKIIVLSFLFVISLQAKDVLSTFLNDPLLQYANVGLEIKEVESGKILYQHRPQHGLIPASTMKVVTTATALELLGPDFRFETKIQIENGIDENGVLNGNLYIYGGGDPTLGSEYLGSREFLRTWVNAIKKAGIKSINGSIIADDTIFDDEGINPRWIWEDIGNYYAAAIYGISYMDNTVRVFFNSGTTGTTPTITKTLPAAPGLTFENNLKSTTIGKDSAYFSGTPRVNHRIIRGEIPANKENFVSKMDMPNPGLLLVTNLHDLLIENDVSVSYLPTMQSGMKGERKTIYTQTSLPLSRIIKEVNFKSNNHYAEHLFRYLGLQISNVGTTQGSIKVINDFWRSKELPVDQLFMYDGSGLSPTNAVSPRFFTDLMVYMKKESKYSKEFYDSLPVAGETGTIAFMLKNTPLHGKVHAKSGSINRVRCYTGYIENKGKTYAFAVMVNNYSTNRPRNVIKRIEEFLAASMEE